MSRHRNPESGIVVSVDDSKDDRYGEGSGWESVEDEKPAPKRAAAKKSEN